MLYHREDHGINRTQNYGSRSGRVTRDALNITKLIYDIARSDKVTMISIFNNAEGCYDRIRYNLMTIGCPDKVALCHARVLNQMKHFVQTTAGISEAFIHAYTRLNIGDVGQGNGRGSISWHSYI